MAFELCVLLVRHSVGKGFEAVCSMVTFKAASAILNAHPGVSDFDEKDF
jgi:hypothetical protein